MLGFAPSSDLTQITSTLAAQLGSINDQLRALVQSSIKSDGPPAWAVSLLSVVVGAGLALLIEPFKNRLVLRHRAKVLEELLHEALLELHGNVDFVLQQHLERVSGSAGQVIAEFKEASGEKSVLQAEYDDGSLLAKQITQYLSLSVYKYAVGFPEVFYIVKTRQSIKKIFEFTEKLIVGCIDTQYKNNTESVARNLKMVIHLIESEAAEGGLDREILLKHGSDVSREHFRLLKSDNRHC